MSLYTEKSLIEACSSQRARVSRRASGPQQDLVKGVWDCLCEWIAAQLQRGQGANVCNFGRFTWLNKSDASSSVRSSARRQSVFLLSDRFENSFGLSQRSRPPVAASGKHLAKTEDINFTKLAIKFSKNLSKDDVFSVTRELLAALGSAIASGQDAEVEFGRVGHLLSRDRAVWFEFGPAFGGTAGPERGVHRPLLPPLDPMLNRNSQPQQDLTVAGACSAPLPPAPPVAPAAAPRDPPPQLQAVERPATAHKKLQPVSARGPLQEVNVNTEDLGSAVTSPPHTPPRLTSEAIDQVLLSAREKRMIKENRDLSPGAQKRIERWMVLEKAYGQGGKTSSS